MIKNFKTTFTNFLTKAIVFNLYLFAFGLFTSKALTSAGGVLVCLFGLIKLIVSRENPFKEIKGRTLNLPILFFILALIVSMVEHPDSKAFSILQKHVLIIVFFYMAVSHLHDLKQIKNIIVLSIISMAIAASYGLYQHYFLDFTNVSGFATHLGFGCLLAMFLIFLMTYGFWGRINIKYRVAALTGIIILGTNLIFTQSRGAWLGFLGGCLTLFWLRNKKMLISLAIVILILALFLPQVYILRFQSIVDLNYPSNLARIGFWKGALLMYRDHYINGIGLGRFSKEIDTNYRQPYIDNTCHAHSNIFQFMAETGTIGLIAFVWLMAAITIWLYKNYLQITNHNWRLFLLASFCGSIVFNIQGLTEVNYGDAETLRFFWFLIALNMAIVNLNKEKLLETNALDGLK